MPFASYPAFNQWLPCSVSPHSDQAVSYRHPYPGSADAQRLSRLRRSYTGFLPSAVLDRMAYAFRKCSTFNQWLPCSVSPYFDQTESCRRPYSGSVDIQHLSRLRRFLRRLSSISDCWIEWFTPFAGIRHSTNGHRAVLHCFLPWQCLVDTSVLVWWMHSVFCASGIPCIGALPLAVTRSNNLCPSLVSGIQPIVTVQCFTAF